MPLGVRRIYAEKSLAYMVTTSDHDAPKIFYDSNEARKEIAIFLGKGYERLDSNLSKADGKPKFFTYKGKNTNNTATITYLRCDLPSDLKAFLEDEAMSNVRCNEQGFNKKEIIRLFESMHTSLASAARVMGITRDTLNSCLYSDSPVTNEVAQRLSAALKGYHKENFNEDILSMALRVDLRKVENSSPKVIERIQSYFENLRHCHYSGGDSLVAQHN